MTLTNAIRQRWVNVLLVGMAALGLSGCAGSGTQSAAIPSAGIGGQRDTHGCLPAAGQTWSYLKQQCVQTFDVADIRFNQQKNGTTYRVDVILSDDRQQAELFAVDVAPNTILTAVKGGYVSADGRLRLLNTDRGWRLRTQ